MPKISQIPVKYKGGYRGPYIDIHQLIDRKIKVDVLDFLITDSKVRGCSFMCKMQLRISGRLAVTWCSSELLSGFLKDCREKEKEDNIVIFPIEQAIFLIGEDRAYYMADAPEDAFVPDYEEFERMKKK